MLTCVPERLASLLLFPFSNSATQLVMKGLMLMMLSSTNNRHIDGAKLRQKVQHQVLIVDVEVAVYAFFLAHSAIRLVMGVISVNVNKVIGKMNVDWF